jgi:ABC-type branched-subunit amino acid transport system substrate-binding protein
VTPVRRRPPGADIDDRRRRRSLTALCCVTALVIAASACTNATSSKSAPPNGGSSHTATTYTGTDFTKNEPVSAPGVTATEIHVGSITSKTNPIGGDNFLLNDGIKAYFDVVNGQGGVWGRKLKLTSERDDQTVGNLNQTQAMLAQDNVYAVFEAVELFTGAKLLAKAGIPTFGWNINAEWAGPTNFFPNIAPICFGNACSSIGKALPWIVQQEHRHKVALIGYAVPQSSDAMTSGAREIQKFSKDVDAQVAYQDVSLQFGQTDYSAQVAQMKAKGVDFLATALDFNGDYALAQEMQRQGILDKVTFFHPNLYNPDFVRTNAKLLEGGIVLIPVLAIEHNPVPSALQDYLDYANSHGMKITEMTEEGWIAARQFVDALKAAGPDFTWAHLVGAWNLQKAYTNGGLVPPIDWTRQHNDPAASVANRAVLQCVNFLRIHDGKFVGIYDDGGAKPWVCFHGQKPDLWERPQNLSFATGESGSSG